MAGDTRERILDVATELFLHYGYKRTTVDEIATAAGISKGSVYLHFNSKEAVFGVASQRICGRVLAIMSQIAGTDEPLEERIHRMLLEAELYVWDVCHKWPISMELWAEILTAAAEYTESAYEAGSKIVAGLIAEGQAEGVFDPNLDPANVAWLIQLALQGFEEPSLMIHSRREIEEYLPQLVELLIRAIKSRGVPRVKECDPSCE